MKKIKDIIKQFGLSIAKGDIWVKLSLIIMGAGYFGRKQIVKGIIMTLFEVAFIWFTATVGVPNLSKFGTLGTVQFEQKFDIVTMTNVVNDYDNSFLILLLSIISLIFIVMFVVIYMANMIHVYNLQVLKAEGKRINTFKQDCKSYINEKFGLHNGNVLLKQIAAFLQTVEKNNGVYRISNRQFGIVFSKNVDLNVVCNMISDRFERAFNFNNINVNVNLWNYMCCIQSSKDIATVNDIFDIIDYSLKEAKQSKKNSVVFASTDVLEKRRREIEITQAISTAIKNASFQVYFQPIYSKVEKRYTNMEALVRLIDDNIGFIPPDEFIPIAEKNGDILAIGEIVLEKVCSFIEEYHPEDFGIKAIHVNLSVVQCMQENINIRLMNIIDKYRIPHSLIDFEITETTADNTSDSLDKIMKDFNEKGIHFSLDDFGTGYSNQTNIMQYPYSIVKIDKSMVWACDSNPKALISLKHTIAMIKDLEMKVLAEGVETLNQQKMLEDIGVEYLQGYYFSRPLPVCDLIEVIKTNSIKGLA